MWDTWGYYFGNTFYLYYLTGPYRKQIWDGVGLAISHDGVHWNDQGKVIDKAEDSVWLGSGAVWPVINRAAREQKFIMNFSEFRGSRQQGRQTIFFAESKDLIHWTRLGACYEFRQDTRWYERNGRWDNIWPVVRPGGGYYGYWAATPKNKVVGLGFGESDDGITWKALEPPVLSDVPLGPPSLQSPEVGAVHIWKGKYYALPGLNDLESVVNNDFTDFQPGHTTMVADSPSGPFVPVPKNRRLLVGNASYFARVIDTKGGVLVNHHSWAIRKGEMLNVEEGTSCMTPLKRAVWDEEGTLRLKWWENNEKAKDKVVAIESQLSETPFDPDRVLILEGVMRFSFGLTGLHLQGMGNRGTGFLVHKNGFVEYGDIDSDGTGFEKKGHVDRDIPLQGTARFRLIRTGRITEFYLNDYLMQCYCLPEYGTGRIGIIGHRDALSNLRAWYCS